MHVAVQAARPAQASGSAQSSGGKSGLTRDEFVGMFGDFSLQQVDALFVHLLHAHHALVVDRVGLRVTARAQAGAAQADAAGRHAPARAGTRRSSRASWCTAERRIGEQPARPDAVEAAAAMPPSALPPPHGVRLTLLGQSLIQYDLRQTEYGRQVLAAMPPYLTADVVFSELETSIAREDGGGQQQRHTVFQHNAPPVVLDCLKQLGINMLALSNNHAGDMGEDGVRVALEEVRKRAFVCAGLGVE